MLCSLYSLDLQLAREQIALTFGKKAASGHSNECHVARSRLRLGRGQLSISSTGFPAAPSTMPQIVVNGNTALALGVVASGMDICAMYPITPATSASHYLSEVFDKVGGIVHQAEDEIAACTFAIGASYAGKCAVTITSGPGYSLKQEGIGLAVMAEIPLVVVNVQRGGPSTGQPTKTEQGDLLAAIYGSHGDAPKVVMAPSTVEDCFYSMITARRIAETFNMVVVVLSDANLATSQTSVSAAGVQRGLGRAAPRSDRGSRRDEAVRLGPSHGSRAPLRSRSAGRHAHGDGPRARSQSHVAYDSGEQRARPSRAQPQAGGISEDADDAAEIFGDPEGDLLIIGWGSTKGAIEEAVGASRAEGARVSSMHLRFLQPLPPGLAEAHGAVPAGDDDREQLERPAGRRDHRRDNRRYSALAMMLRSRYLVDVDCWSQVRGAPIRPERDLRGHPRRGWGHDDCRH